MTGDDGIGDLGEDELHRRMHGWFGEPCWGACFTDDGEVDEAMRIPIPLDHLCFWCKEPFTSRDSGQAVPMMTSTVMTIITYQHRECLLRSVIGGLDHLAGRCTCYIDHDDDGLGSLADGMTIRQEALAVDDFVTRHKSRHVD
jgi:hypothetical protein